MHYVNIGWQIPPNTIRHTNVGPPSATLAQHWNNTVELYHAGWDNFWLFPIGLKFSKWYTEYTAVQISKAVTAFFSSKQRRHWAIVGLMLVQRLWRWPNIKLTMVQCLVFARILCENTECQLRGYVVRTCTFVNTPCDKSQASLLNGWIN